MLAVNLLGMCQILLYKRYNLVTTNHHRDAQVSP